VVKQVGADISGALKGFWYNTSPYRAQVVETVKTGGDAFSNPFDPNDC